MFRITYTRARPLSNTMTSTTYKWKTDEHDYRKKYIGTIFVYFVYSKDTNQEFGKRFSKSIK